MKHSWLLSGLTKHPYPKSYIEIRRLSTEELCNDYFDGAYEKEMEEVWKWSVHANEFFFFFLFLSDEGPMLETLDYTIRIGSTPTFLYFDLYY